MVNWLPAHAQWESPLYRISGRWDFAESDPLLNIYAIRGSEIVKHDPAGQFLFRYSDMQLGNISHTDATFPLRLLLLYNELNYAILLDNTLSDKRGAIHLLNHGVGLAQVGCSSVQNHFWFYDAMSFSLSRHNENFQKVLETGNLAQILGISLEPTYMAEFANRVYVNNPATGILVFDIFGTYIKTLPIRGIERFQIFENSLAYHSKGRLYRYDLRTGAEWSIALPDGCLQALWIKDRIAVLTPNEIAVYKAPARE
jgi:hypothetical protein